MHVAALDIAIRASKVDILHGAHQVTLIQRVVVCANAVVVDSNDLTWLDITDILSTNDIQSTCLRADNISLTKLTQGQRAQAMLIATSIYAALCHNQEGESSLQHIESLHDVVDTLILALILLHKVSQELTIARRVKQRATHLEIVGKFLRVHQVTVVRKGEVTRMVAKLERLHVVSATATSCSVAHMADSDVTLELRELLLVEHLGNKTLALDSI